MKPTYIPNNNNNKKTTLKIYEAKFTEFKSIIVGDYSAPLSIKDRTIRHNSCNTYA